MAWTTKHKLAATMLPMALVAVHSPAFAQAAANANGMHDGAWRFAHENVLGTSLDVRVRAASFTEAQRAEAAALQVFDREEARLSSWRKDSELSQWERTRFTPVKVSPELFAMLASFDAWREKSNGALDASSEAAAQLWKRAAAEGRKPSQQEIAATVEAMQQPHWKLDAATQTATRLSDVPLAFATFAKSAITSKAAEAAMVAGASGVMLNVGGDVVVRGALTELVAVANPQQDAENDAALAELNVRDRAVATSGSYRREVAAAMSHILDPRTAMPTGHVLSSTVIAHDAETAGALATAMSVLTPAESAALAANTNGAEYMLVLADGSEVRSAGWSAYENASVKPVMYTAPHAPAKVAAGAWNPAFELSIALELPRIEDARYRRPYVAVWVEDADHFPVRTIALWTENPRWLPELKQWYHDDQIRNLAEGTDISKTVSSATRPAGKYTLKWDGKDNEGKLVKSGKYTICIEASREHGGYEIERREIDFNGAPSKAAVSGSKELGAVTLDYHKR
ncbi:DUF2271 domain-containing protein [Granulicella cerasi]|uniref:FAD:protein FMN transferase n=1 Tax=Granulicella cerasi TaxID=741063 RepID=A0ABW1ZCS1_9BACT|nr:DUF2271 domain-containing protein [Granulicella cerasi]